MTSLAHGTPALELPCLPGPPIGADDIIEQVEDTPHTDGYSRSATAC